MGCTSSREARRDRRRSPVAYSRSHSMPVPSSVGGSCRRVGDSNRHIVALTSSTLGSLRLDEYVDDGGDEIMMKSTNDGRGSVGKEPNDKAWSDMIESRIPKTPTKTPSPPEPETINAWELMAGLEEAEAEAPPSVAVAERSFSFTAAASPKPLWMQISPDESIVSDFDPDILSNFRKALDQLSPQHQSLLRSPEPARKSIVGGDDGQPKFAGIVKARITAFQQKIDAKRGKKCPPSGERKVVFYFTSLRGIRKTYEDCWAVKVILQGYGVKVDERDVSLHAGFKDELIEILGRGSPLPRVFANARYLGGAEEIRQMHEAGELGKALEECEAAVIGKGGGGGGACDGCGGVRFVPCDNCSGSCKVFVEEEEEEMEVVGEFRRCPECNENGLVRCSFCW